MTNEFKIISEDGLKTLCKAIKKVSTIGEIIDDDNSVTDKTYSSFKIDGRLNTKIDKTQLTTVLDENVTDEQIPGAKAIFDTIINKKGECVTIRDTDLDTVLKGGLYYVHRSCANIPYDCLGGYMCVLYHDLDPNNYVIQILFSWDGKNIYYRNKTTNWLNWGVINTTKVADVNETSIEFDETALGLTIVNNHSLYKVINGICYVTIEINVVPPTENKIYGYTKISTTSIPKIGFSTKATLNVVESNSSISAVLDRGLTIIKLHGNILAREGSCIIQGSFSYPVAE